jgi:hypothetical protein
VRLCCRAKQNIPDTGLNIAGHENNDVVDEDYYGSQEAYLGGILERIATNPGHTNEILDANGYDSVEQLITEMQGDMRPNAFLELKSKLESMGYTVPSIGVDPNSAAYVAEQAEEVVPENTLLSEEREENKGDPVKELNYDIENGKYEELQGIEIVRFKGETNRTYTESDNTTSDIARIVINAILSSVNPLGQTAMELSNIDAVKDETVNHDKIGGVYSRKFKGRQRVYSEQSTPFMAYYQYVDITIEYDDPGMSYGDIVYIDVVNDGGPVLDRINRN